MRVAIVISPDIQDRYFASVILEQFDVVGLFVEPQYSSGGPLDGLYRLGRFALKNRLSPKAFIGRWRDERFNRDYRSRVAALYHQHFHERGVLVDKQRGCPVYHTGLREVSSPQNIARLKALRPDVVAVCGCSLLNREFLSVPPFGTLNLHGGLSQYYRGCNCYFWALYENVPERAGVTIHYVSPGIDDGDILYQGRPAISAEDDEITLFIKMMKLGTNLMVRALGDIEQGREFRNPLPGKGRLCLDNAITVPHVRDLHERLGRGMLRDRLPRGYVEAAIAPVLDFPDDENRHQVMLTSAGEDNGYA